jgi:hypothetical protein
MSDTSPGPGWWLASDGRWYAPELHPDAAAPIADQQVPSASPPEEALASWAPAAAVPMQGPPVPAYPPEANFGNPDFSPGALGSAPGSGPSYPRGWQPVVPASSGGRFSRGLRLVGIGFTMARDEPGLMMVPVVAFVVQLVIFGIGALVLLPTLRSTSTTTGQSAHLSAGQWLVLVVAGVLVMFVSVVSHATIIARVMARFHGRSVTNAQAARAALTKSPQLLAWAFINYVVISILRSIGNRGLIGFLVGALLRAGWMLASFFVVPVILFEDKGAVASIKRSVELCRSRWGENIVGNGALGIIGFVAILADVAVAVALGMVFAPIGVVVGVIGLAPILLVLTVATAAFNAALYWYAVTDQSPGQYSVGDLQSAYRQKGRKTGVYGF